MKVGILGGGQLARMLCLAGLPLGLEFRILDPAPDACAAPVAAHIMAAYDDIEGLTRFADGLDVVTYEFENVPEGTAAWLNARVPVYPPPVALQKSQDRLIEKTFLQSLGVPTAPFAAVSSRGEFNEAVAHLGLPAVLKTRRMGYDGKGQYVLRASEDITQAGDALPGRELILEGFVPFERELSLLAVRGKTGDIRFYPLVENQHQDGILHISKAPAPDLTPALQQQAERYARLVLESVDYVGVLTIEFFQVGARLTANETAPRVHNSGHWTIEGAQTSQFENHLRAVCGLPLGATDALGTSAMQNFIGELPDTNTILALPGAHLHLYGKHPRPGRKLGHVTYRNLPLPDPTSDNRDWLEKLVGVRPEKNA